MASKDIRVILEGMGETLEKAVVKVTLAITAELTRSTPIDVGWARANWVPSIGVSFNGFPEVVERRDKEASLSAAAAAQASGLASVVTGYKVNKGSVFITNNVSYIVELDQGSSRQAPAGFVSAAVFKAVRSAT